VRQGNHTTHSPGVSNSFSLDRNEIICIIQHCVVNMKIVDKVFETPLLREHHQVDMCNLECRNLVPGAARDLDP